MLSRWSQVMGTVGRDAGLRSRAGRLLVALSLTTIAPEVAAAARKSGRRTDNQGHEDDKSRDNYDDSAKTSQDERDSDGSDGSKASAEGQDTSDKSGKSGKHNQNQERSANDESSGQNGSDGGKSRDHSSHRSADSNPSQRETSNDDSSHHHGARHAEIFAQKADAPANDPSQADSAPDNAADATTTPANPIDSIPDTSLNDLVVQGNDHVLASVSSSGGFAFARSGDVVAVTGPDGASIIQRGGTSTGTSGTNPTEPSSDGGNNDVGFSS